MPRITRHPAFETWLRDLRDDRAFARIAIRLNRLAAGHAGDVRPIGEGVREIRIDYGPGYRIDFVQRGSELVILLCGGDKGSQARDIVKAKDIARSLKP